MNSYWNREADSELTLDLLCFSQIDFRFNICFKNLLFFAMSWLVHSIFSGIDYEFTFQSNIFTENSFGLNRFFHREFAINTLSAPRFHYYFPIWIHYLNSWYVLRIGFESGIFFENLLWIHSFRKFSKNSPPISFLHFECSLTLNIHSLWLFSQKSFTRDSEAKKFCFFVLSITYSYISGFTSHFFHFREIAKLSFSYYFMMTS